MSDDGKFAHLSGVENQLPRIQNALANGLNVAAKARKLGRRKCLEQGACGARCIEKMMSVLSVGPLLFSVESFLQDLGVIGLTGTHWGKCGR